MELLLPFWILCGFIACVIASGKGRSGFGWFLLGILFGPLALLAVAVASPDRSSKERAGLRNKTLRACPQCAETIKAEAVKCRFCGANVDPLKFDVWGRQLN
jgi:hypothetical protein